MKFIWRSFYLPNQFFIVGLIIVIAFVVGHFFIAVNIIAKLSLIIFIAFFILDIIFQYRTRNGVLTSRQLPDRFSNGDNNPVHLRIENRSPYDFFIKLIDEVPVQFQKRESTLTTFLKKGKVKNHTYYLVPIVRGEYIFGKVNVFVKTRLGLVERRYIFDLEQSVAVYPSFLQLQNFELLSFAKMQSRLGIKPIKKAGNNKEFDQTRDYVIGDESKHINWKATARKSRLMVNQFRDQREQDVYCIIDLGRNMKMPFEGMSIVDYAINSTLAVSKVVLKNHDKIGLITYSNRIQTILPSNNRNSQLPRMMEALYNQNTDFKESTIEPLYEVIKRKVSHRSLLIIYTNFESVYSMQRQLEILKKLRRNHLVILISFENMELNNIVQNRADNITNIYLKTIVEKFVFEKRVLMQDLIKIGIHTVLSAPDELSINTINKYLEIKARGLL